MTYNREAAKMLEAQLGKDLMIKQGYVPATCSLEERSNGSK